MPLSRDKIEEIELSAKEVLENAYGKWSAVTPPVDLNKVTKSLGLGIKRGKFADDQIVGAYNKDKKEIYVSEDDSYGRQAFTVAHEIGHYKLHKDKDQEVFYRKDMALLDQEDRKVEREANWFAASLLMPKELVETAWPVYKDIDVMAQAFQVSTGAMRYRLQNLRLL